MTIQDINIEYIEQKRRHIKNGYYEVAVNRLKKMGVRQIILDIYDHFGSYRLMSDECAQSVESLRDCMARDRISNKLAKKIEIITNGKFKARDIINI